MRGYDDVPVFGQGDLCRVFYGKLVLHAYREHDYEDLVVEHADAVVVRLSGSPTADWYVASGMASLLRGSDPTDGVEPLPAHVADATVGAALAGCAVTAMFAAAAYGGIEPRDVAKAHDAVKSLKRGA